MNFVNEKIKNILIYSLAVEKESIHTDVKLIELGLDSFNYIHLIAELEDDLQVEFDDSLLDFFNIETFGQLCMLVENEIKKNKE